MAAGIADLGGGSDRLRLPGDKLGKAVSPARRDPMGGGSVDDPRRVRAHRVDQMRRLLGRLVRQAKDHDIDFAVELALCGRVLARLGRQAQELDAGNACELFPDLQAGGARFAIDEDFRRHDRLAQVRKPKEKSRFARIARAQVSVVAVRWASGRS